MRATLVFLRASVIGGILFLLPVGVVLVVAGKLFAISRGAADTLHDSLFPDAASRILPLVFAILSLVAIAFAAGIFARTRLGRRTFSLLEEAILSRLPVYTLLKQTLEDMAGGAASLAGGREVKVVIARFDDHRAVGFLVERLPEGDCVVYLPGAPSAFTGSVVIMPPDRVTDAGVAPKDVLNAMRRLGAGVVALQKR